MMISAVLPINSSFADSPLSWPGPEYEFKTLNPSQLRNFDKSIKRHLRTTARELALNTWPDTILEGPYQTRMIIALDKLDLVSKEGVLVGYHMTYSVKAYHMDHCSYDPATKEEFCQAGRIRESAFVKVDFSDALVNPQQQARFFF